jgi:acetamidase/formamidase
MGPYGGNLDATGSTRALGVLAVYEPGAYFLLGDGHAGFGDGELIGQGTERPWTSSSR